MSKLWMVKTIKIIIYLHALPATQKSLNRNWYILVISEVWSPAGFEVHTIGQQNLSDYEFDLLQLSRFLLLKSQDMT